MCLNKQVQHGAAVLPVPGGRVRTAEDYFLLILRAQRPLATLAAAQKPFNSLGWMFCASVWRLQPLNSIEIIQRAVT